MKNLPIGIQNFRKIIEGNYVYIDKTQYVYDLVMKDSYYFLSRPRRFGKSLLLDTIAEVFNGERELFRGLWIYNSDYDFKQYPVIRIDMSNISNNTSAILEQSLMSLIKKRYRQEGFIIEDDIVADAFAELIALLHKKYKERVVVLIDEYDKPILDHIKDLDTAESNRQVIKGFYGILKSMDPHLRFTMMTGVSKFTKTSVFSELNNMLDITMSESFAGICGITADDFDIYFSEHMNHLTKNEKLRRYSDIRTEIIKWYDGYSWDGETRVLNPFSLLSFFRQERFAGFWYASGTPGFLVGLIKNNPEAFSNIHNLKITEDMLNSGDINKIEIEPLLFQTGYLTVKEVTFAGDEMMYLLEIPNFEVKNAFNLHVISSLTEAGDTTTRNLCDELNEAFKHGDMEKAVSALQRLFSSIPYQLHVKAEAYYHSIIYAIMCFTGLNITSEVSVSGGRVDAVLEYTDRVYVMEFKYADCPKDVSTDEKRRLFDKALGDGIEQIENKGYYKKYLGGNRIIYKTAFAFLGRDDIEMKYEVCQ